MKSGGFAEFRPAKLGHVQGDDSLKPVIFINRQRGTKQSLAQNALLRWTLRWML